MLRNEWVVVKPQKFQIFAGEHWINRFSGMNNG